MQSSYSLIKNGYSKIGESKVITTNYVKKHDFKKIDADGSEIVEEIQNKIDPEELLKRYEEIGERIIRDAENEKKALILRTQMEASVSEKKAYEKGYNEGKQNGYEDGYKEAYEETINNATKQAEDIISKAEKLLSSAQNEYEKYLSEKKNEVINLAINIAETITRMKLKDDNSLNDIIEDVFRASRGEENVIIRVNEVHIKSLQENCERWKSTYSIKKSIFVINDESLEPGNAILEKSTGIVKVGIDIGMEQIKNSILG